MTISNFSGYNMPYASQGLQILNPHFESRIRQTFRYQDGALNLLNDLKKHPFTWRVQVILERLERGVYGVFSTEFDCHLDKLILDLRRHDFIDLVEPAKLLRYDHRGP